MKKRSFLFISLAVLAVVLLGAGTIYYLLFAPSFHPKTSNVYVYLDRDDTVDSVYNKVSQVGNPRNMIGFYWLSRLRHYDRGIHTGRYVINANECVYRVFNRFYKAHQTPMNLVIRGPRTLNRLARDVGKQLMIDSVEIADRLNDTLWIHQLGYNEETLPSLFIPNTYEVYWNISVDAFLQRMCREHKQFWNDTRLRKAETIGLTPVQVATLASIVEEETNNASERPVVAGLYINRLHKGMPLQADPTIKYALQNFSLQRITNADLSVNSPYNTYMHIGLPPGPIRIASPSGIDAVLNYTRHNYLYMCAKEDFSGTHNFASTYSEHIKNARKYRRALNERKIFR